MNTNPLVSIGMPVYNGEKFVRAALDSILAQTFTDFELIISDNASTDATESICRDYAAKDSRIRYIRMDNNFGALYNFNFVLQEASAKYFMWAACDDVRSLDFVDLNVTFLQENSDYVASTSPVRFEGEQFDSQRMGDSTLSGRVVSRVCSFFNYWHANARLYSLFRTDSIKLNPFLQKDFFGADWAFMVHVLMRGKTKCLNKGWVRLGKSGFSNSSNIFSFYRKSYIHYIVPFYELLKEVNCMILLFPISAKAIINYHLLALNAQAVIMSAKISLKYLISRYYSRNKPV